ncbi:hypothetical protein C8R42DRAFT_641588 [Lentinula raphanica]|nr:hypothetical protein C8R42DRAFT_641588 [Lentinula raphanica]
MPTSSVQLQQHSQTAVATIQRGSSRALSHSDRSNSIHGTTGSRPPSESNHTMTPPHNLMGNSVGNTRTTRETNSNLGVTGIQRGASTRPTSGSQPQQLHSAVATTHRGNSRASSHGDGSSHYIHSVQSHSECRNTDSATPPPHGTMGSCSPTACLGHASELSISTTFWSVNALAHFPFFTCDTPIQSPQQSVEIYTSTGLYNQPFAPFRDVDPQASSIHIKFKRWGCLKSSRTAAKDNELLLTH